VDLLKYSVRVGVSLENLVPYLQKLRLYLVGVFEYLVGELVNMGERVERQQDKGLKDRGPRMKS